MNIKRLESRNSGIELLRIIAILLITLHHYALYGIITPLNPESGVNLFRQGGNLRQLVTWFFYSGGDIGNIIFFLITGFFLINSKRTDFKRFVLEIFFYSFLTLCIFSINTFFFEGSFYRTISHDEKVKSFWAYLVAPFSSSRFWFCTAYIAIVFVSPLLNAILQKINRKGFIVLLSVFYIPFIALGTYYVYPYLGFTKALYFYSLGAYIKLFSTDTNKKKRLLFFYILVFVLSIFCYGVIRLGIDKDFPIVFWQKHRFNHFFALQLTYGVFATICAVSLLKFFALFEFKNKIVNFISSTTLGVYLLQEGLFGRTLIFGHLLNILQTQYFKNLYPLYALITVLIIFFICCFIDIIRQLVFEPVYLFCYEKFVFFYNKHFVLESTCVNE